MSDTVNHPAHYTGHPSGVECITVTEHMNFCRGNAMKYLWRAGEKGSELEDLRKARWYLDREISRLETEASAANAADQKKAELHQRWLKCEIDMWPTWQHVPAGVYYRGWSSEGKDRWVNRQSADGLHRKMVDCDEEFPSYLTDEVMSDLAPFVRVEG